MEETLGINYQISWIWNARIYDIGDRTQCMQTWVEADWGQRFRWSWAGVKEDSCTVLLWISQTRERATTGCRIKQPPVKPGAFPLRERERDGRMAKWGTVLLLLMVTGWTQSKQVTRRLQTTKCQYTLVFREMECPSVQPYDRNGGSAMHSDAAPVGVPHTGRSVVIGLMPHGWMNTDDIILSCGRHSWNESLGS